MPTDGSGPSSDVVPTRSRRSVLAAAAATAGALAGCTSSLTDQEFEATPVRLPGAAQEDLVLAETAVDSSTTTRNPDVAGVEGEVTITSHVATYQRGPARGRPTVLEAFVGGVNGTPGSGAAAVVSGSGLDVDEFALPMFEEEVSVPGDQFSLVVPGGARDDGEVALEETMALVPGSAIPGPRWAPGNEWVSGSRWVPGPQWFPRSEWMPDDDSSPGSRWFPGLVYDFDNPHEVALMTPGDYSGALFDFIGQNYDELPGRPFEEGEAFETEDAILAVPGDAVGEHLDPTNVSNPTNVYDGAIPAPLGGATFGSGVLSTPVAEVGGQSVNPVAGMDLADVLTSDAARELLGATGITDADEVEWLAGPEEVSTGGQSPFTVLDQEADQGTFVGVVSGEHGPWGVAVNLARVAGEDVVVAAGTQAAPVGSVEIPGPRWLGTGGEREIPGPRWLDGGIELSAATFESLRVGVSSGE